MRKPWHPKGTAKTGKSLFLKKVSTYNPVKLLEKAVKNFEQALKSAKKTAGKKGVTSESMKATLAKHTVNQREVADIFHNMPAKLLSKPAVSQAFQQMLADNKQMPSPTSRSPTPDHQPQELFSTFGKTAPDLPPEEPMPTLGKTTPKPKRAAPEAFIAEFHKQKQDEFAETDDIDQVCDYMMQIKKHNGSSKLLHELARSFPDYQAAGWDVDQFMTFCYEAQLALHEERADNPASAMAEADRRMSQI